MKEKPRTTKPRRKKILPDSTANRRRSRRVVLVALFFCLCMGYLFYQVWYIQNVRGDDLNRQSSEFRVNRMNHLSTINPHRGWIMDRNMQPLAASHLAFDIALDISMLAYRENAAITRGGPNRRQWMDETLHALHETLDIPMADLNALFVRDAEGFWRPIIHDNWRIVARQVSPDIAIPLRDNHIDIYLDDVSVRTYADPFLAPHVLGFIRGGARWGLEGRYFDELMGTPGRLFRTFDANNTLIREEVPVQHGMTLVTTLDADIQRLAQQTVDATFLNIQTDAVALLVMCPRTAEIFAMAQAPNFSLAEPDNVALFTDPLIYANWAYMSPQEHVNTWNYVWRNYHTTHSFEPGSIFKPIVVAAALEQGAISPHDVFFCGGTIDVSGEVIPCFNHIAHGSLNVSQILAASCNVGTIQIMQRLGRDDFYRFRGYFGYGERTGIDLPGEMDVSAPQVMYRLQDLGPVQMATSSIGQGFNATAIQSAVSFASLINGGMVMRPFIVSHVIDENGAIVQENRPQLIRRAISQDTSDWMRTELENVITGPGGTGRQTRIPGHAIGGKTGTAQHGAERELLSIAYWIYTPVENPEFLIFILAENVEHGRTAGNTLAPILRNFMEELIILRNIPPSEGPYIEDWHSPILNLTPMPDFIGTRVNDMVRTLINLDISFQIHGGGTVVASHLPGPDRSMPQPGGIPVQIHTDPATYIPGGMTVMPNVTGMNAAQALEFLRDATYIPHWFGGEGELSEYEIYRQYPAAGTETEQGMHVMMRVRRRN